MATIRKRSGKWQAQVRHRGLPTLSRTFQIKADALRWSKQTEAAVDRHGMVPDRSVLKNTSLGDLLRRFRDEVCPDRKGCEVETFLINAFLRTDLSKKPLSDLTPEGFALYRDKRLKRVRPASINRELGLVQRILEVARIEWGLPLGDNPVKSIRKPKPDNSRDRRLRQGEWDRILEASKISRNRYILPLTHLALATGMRRSEILNACWSDLSWTKNTLHLRETKNGHSRTIPVTEEAKRVLASLGTNYQTTGKIIPISEEAAKLGWQRLVKRAKIEELHFHDLRHNIGAINLRICRQPLLRNAVLGAKASKIPRDESPSLHSGKATI